MSSLVPAASRFWELEPSSAPALFERGRIISRAELVGRADEISRALADIGKRSFGFLCFASNADSVAAYLACLRGARAAPLLVNPGLNRTLLQDLAGRYRPDWMADEHDAPVLPGYRPVGTFGRVRLSVSADRSGLTAPHPDLALLLSTSGSTGSAKLVRLSWTALAANTAAIVEYLDLGPSDRTATTLPLAYSFGMSVLNVHLASGGAVALTSDSLISREFWETAAATGVTNLSGVPGSFEMFRRVGLDRRGLDRLRFLAQAGGAMRPDLTRFFADMARDHGWSLFVMYGQTEAGPRISYLPPDRLHEKIGSIGIAVPGGELRIDASTHELIYRGPNVMMGYAESRDDLARGDECGGELATGDLARRDEDGFFYLTGRSKRFVKMSGVRVSLDEVEQRVGERLSARVACTGADDALEIWLADFTEADAAVTSAVRDLFGIFAGNVSVRRLAELPANANGKIDYGALRAQAENG